MYLWTQKAEDDFRTRHPHIREKDVKRRAGEPATYDGATLKTGEVSRAFQMRGWISSVKDKKKEKAKKKEQMLWSQWQKRMNEKQIILEA